jgi:hypothetical protein
MLAAENHTWKFPLLRVGLACRCLSMAQCLALTEGSKEATLKKNHSATIGGSNMNRTGVAIISLALALLSQSARAEVDTFTQVGSFRCQPIRERPDSSPSWKCPDNISFPEEFGAAPNVIVSFSTLSPLGSGQTDVKAANITNHGFKPVMPGLPPTGPGGRLLPVDVGVGWVAVGPVLLRGTATAKYLVLSVIYAPPGTNGGHSSSSVAYSAGSTTGVTTSASQSFKAANALSFEGEGGFLGSGGGGGLSFEFSRSVTDTQALEIKKSVTSTIGPWPGPSQDGINHDEDVIYLALKPTINLALSSSSAAWSRTAHWAGHVDYICF